MRNSLPVVIGGLMLLAASSAQASNCAQFNAGDINLSYDPLGAQATGQTVQPVTLTGERKNKTTGGVQIQFVDYNDSTTPLHIGTRGPLFDVEAFGKSIAIGRAQGAMMPNQYFTYTFRSKNTYDYENIPGVQLYIDPGQNVPAGIYYGSLDVQYRCLTSGQTFSSQSNDIQSGVLHVNVNVPSELIANLSGGSTVGTIDFGNFSDTTRSASVNVASTGPFFVLIESDHHYRMVLDGVHSPATNQKIDYDLSFNGYPFDGRPLHFLRTGIGGAGLPLTVHVHDTHGKRNGLYKDTLTVTITPAAF
ncbi:MAG TPA: hypothetical protein VGG36_00840 [Rhizomicrobium sp.]|jgi:hypothetical protein